MLLQVLLRHPKKCPVHIFVDRLSQPLIGLTMIFFDPLASFIHVPEKNSRPEISLLSQRFEQIVRQPVLLLLKEIYGLFRNLGLIEPHLAYLLLGSYMNYDRSTPFRRLGTSQISGMRLSDKAASHEACQGQFSNFQMHFS